ncbi:hypothetical protein OIU77_020076 [Salix suchowensis]|uniref:Rho termination factor-like N-terminal domain-containing protein n=1 Tax=Salix suchowensis TaxID=1278906 RepID=A0ABQ9CIB1_9ROSI|nr:hypothetical protein OIU77_020076 [Salix suchowensis]
MYNFLNCTTKFSCLYGSVPFAGYGSSEGRCLLCSGISGRAVAVSPCSPHSVRYNHSQAQFGKMKCSFRVSSTVCRSSGGHRRNPDFSRPNKQVSRNRNKQNEERSSFENLDESDLLTSKNRVTALLLRHPKPENGAYKKAKSTSSFNSSKKERNNTLEPNNSFSRPPSNFRRKSPVPQVKFQPIYSDTTEELELDPEIEPEEEPELDSEQEPESSLPAGDVFDELSERESSDIENVDEGGEKHQLTEHEDLSSLKLPELRVLARSRGMKGFSRMKKGELVGLLSGSSV